MKKISKQNKTYEMNNPDLLKHTYKVVSICQIKKMFKGVGVPKPTERLILLFFSINEEASVDINPLGTQKYFTAKFDKKTAEKIVANTNLVEEAKKSKAARKEKNDQLVEKIFQNYKKTFNEYVKNL